MKNAEKMSERELRAELSETRALLALANCPDFRCLKGIVTTGKKIDANTWEQYPCQWCTERFELIGP